MKKRILYLLVLPLLSSLFSCDKQHLDPYSDLGFRSYVVDQHGNDLLNPNNENSIETSRVRAFYKKEGKMIEYEVSGICFFREPDLSEDKYSVSVALSLYTDNEGKSVTIIRWNDYESDTIEVKISKKEYSIIATDYTLNSSTPNWVNKELKLAQIIKNR